MTCSELRLLITDLCPSIGFLMVPTLDDGTGWKLSAFTDSVNIVDVRYYHAPKYGDVQFVVTSDALRTEWAIHGTPMDVANKVVDILTTRTLS